MFSDPIISLRGVGKIYRAYDHPLHRLLARLSGGRIGRYKAFPALTDVSFDIHKGERVAIIGRNGSGKSTLLQIISGIRQPTAGTVRVKGRIAALLELGSGFQPEFTGRENIFLQGAIVGLSRSEMSDRFNDIVAFADIGEYLDQPVRTYSSGMTMRLAFAVQVKTDPDILIVDEALSVGDFFFQQKCLSYIRALCENGTTLLFVSHDIGAVRDMCTRAVYLKAGRVQFVGESRLAISAYLAQSGAGKNLAVFSDNECAPAEQGELQAILHDSVWAASTSAQPPQSGKLIAVAFYDSEGNPGTSYRLGSTMHIKVMYVPEAGNPTHVTIEIKNKFDQVVTSVGSSRLNLSPPVTQPEQRIIFEFRMGLQLEAGNYSLVVNLGRLTGPNRGEMLDSTDQIGPITIYWDYENDPAPFFGLFGLPVSGNFKTMPVKE